MRVALFCGSFDPPTLGHQSTINKLLDHSVFDKDKTDFCEFFEYIIVVPTGTNRIDKKNEICYFRRLELCKLVFEPLSSRIIVSEMDKEHLAEDQLIKKFQVLYGPDSLIYMVFGGDVVFDIDEWDSYYFLKKYDYIIIVDRDMTMSYMNKIFNRKTEIYKKYIDSDQRFDFYSKIVPKAIILKKEEKNSSLANSTEARALLKNFSKKNKISKLDFKCQTDIQETLNNVYASSNFKDYICFTTFKYIIENQLFDD